MKKLLLICALLGTAFVIHAKKVPDWKLGVSIGIDDDFPQEVFDAAKKAGFTYVEAFVYRSILTDTAREEKIATFRNRVEKAGLKMWSVHIPYGWTMDISEPDPAKHAEYEQNILTFLELARGFGKYQKAILHTSFEPIKPEVRQARLDALKSSAGPFAAKIKERFGVSLVLECLPRTCLGNTSEEMLWILEGNDNVGVCFDSNHLLKESPEAFVRALGSKITTTHISDYDGIDEKHWLPGAEKGVIDWVAVSNALGDARYKGPIMFEVMDILFPKDSPEYPKTQYTFQTMADFWKTTRATCNK